tara:strand:+ start:3143 stop:4282 length:1140 start_codon:yes stop_codon:yes gene_type:complete
MAVYKLFPSQDTTLYSMYPTMNTGIDPINQVSNLNFALSTSPTVARTLIQFETSEIQDLINNKVSGNWEAYIKSFIATGQGVYKATTLEIFPVTESWYNGTGTYLDQPLTTDGANWGSPTIGGGTTWSAGDGITTTSSYSAPYSPVGGGSWYISSSAASGIPQILYPYTQSFTTRNDKDLSVKVTETVHDWYSGSISNNGFILKWDNSIEFNPNIQAQPVLQYYSIDTNTIYPPELEFRWDDYVDNTSGSSITTLSSSNLFIALDENPGQFFPESVNRFRLNVREEYPKRVFQTSSIYTTQHYLPTSSYYAIKDLDTNEYVVDFDTNYTKISADQSSNYFDIYMNGLEPERYYKILIKVDNGSLVQVYDKDYYFKIING